VSSLEKHYSAANIESRILDGLRAAGIDPEQRVTPEALAALDHFHTGGMQSSRELQDLASIKNHERVLDIGAGLAGFARVLADAYGCQVDCVEMSEDYCVGARLLNRLTGLEELVAVHQCSALDLPFPDNSMDVALMQNVGMNIEDKQTLYQEIGRVLKPGGRFVFQEVAAGSTDTSYFPLPWTTGPADNFLVTPDDMHALLGDSGFNLELFEDISDHDFSRNVANATPAAQGQLGLGIFVGDLALKAGNAQRSLSEGQIRLVRGVFRFS